MELRCLSWARALVNLVYSFVAQFEPPPIEVSQIQFVLAGLAISQNTTRDKGHVLLVEQEIKGKFYKFLSNGSAKILPLPTAELVDAAQVCAFMQHVQYIKTKKLAFVSDFQGK